MSTPALLDRLARLPAEEAEAVVRGLSDEQAFALLFDWEATWARPPQRMPPGDWDAWLLLSGRGTGKTRVGSEAVRRWAKQLPGCHIALVARTPADARDAMIELGESSILKISPPDFMPKYEPSKRRVTWPNGSTATHFSDEVPGQLRGPQFHKAWVDELAKFRHPEETWEQLDFGLRLGNSPQVVVTTTPRPIPLIKSMVKEPGIIVSREATRANVSNLSRNYIDRVVRRYEGTRLARQELEGEIIDEMPGALWKFDDIESHRTHESPQLRRVVIGVDPHATTGETGIVAAGIAYDGHVYVLDDATRGGSPNEWGTAVVACYRRNAADRIIGEVNNGGDMVGHVIHTIDASLPFKKVTASRGKKVRAEPVSALYEQGRVHHVGRLAELEDEQTTWDPEESTDSPNRVDALVWAITELIDPQSGQAGTKKSPI